MSIDRRMLLRGALACACCMKAGVSIASDAPAGGGAAIHWSYEGDGNPEKWGELQSDFKMCQLGLEQTPIDLASGIKGDVGSVEYRLQAVAASHRQQWPYHPVQRRSGQRLLINGARYELLQFHLHHPSEHLLAGKGFDLECHFVHKSSAGALAVTGVFIRPGAANAALKTFFEFDARQGRSGGEGRRHDRYRGHAAEVWRLLPLHGFADDAALFGRPDLDGSQGAGRGVGRQIEKFASLFSKNARPLQKRNRRFLIDAS